MLKKLLLIVNPVAGQKRMKPVLMDVITIFAEAGYAATVMITAKRGDATEFAKDGNRYDLIVCCGGDGTLNECISGMLCAKVKTPLGYISCGSTNDFAASMGISTNIKKTAKSIVNGVCQPLDVGEFNGRYFTYVASFGAFTAASYNASQEVKNILGHAAYIFEGIKDLSSIKPQHIRFETEDQVYEGDYVFGAIANSTSFGGVVKLKEEIVSLNDGLFEVILIRMPKNLNELNIILSGLSSSKFDHPQFDFFKASSLRICPAQPTEWSLDGEYMHTDGEVSMKNLHAVIEFVK